MNIIGSRLAAHSSLLSHRYYFFFFVIPAFSLFSFKCKFDVILFCLLRTSENFQTLRRSLTTNKVSMRMIICGEDVDRVTRSCLWSKSRRRQSMLSFSNPPYVDDCYSHSQNFWTSLDFVFCHLFSLFCPLELRFLFLVRP